MRGWWGGGAGGAGEAGGGGRGLVKGWWSPPSPQSGPTRTWRSIIKLNLPYSTETGPSQGLRQRKISSTICCVLPGSTSC